MTLILSGKVGSHYILFPLVCDVFGFFCFCFSGCFHNFPFIFGFSSVLVIFCCLIHYFKTYQLKQNAFIISQFLWVRNPELGHSFLTFSHLPVFSGLTVRSLHGILSYDWCQHSVPCGLLARRLGFSWPVSQRLPSVPCHMVLSTEHLTAQQVVSWKQARCKGWERDRAERQSRETESTMKSHNFCYLIIEVISVFHSSNISHKIQVTLKGRDYTRD